jgi:hypothetical protein
MNVCGGSDPTRTTKDQLIFLVSPSGICALTSRRNHVEPHQEDAQEDQLRQFLQELAEFGVLPGQRVSGLEPQCQVTASTFAFVS